MSTDLQPPKSCAMKAMAAHASFARRHFGQTPSAIAEILSAINVPSLEALIDQTVPPNIRRADKMALPKALNEHEALTALKNRADKNKVMKSMIGMGYFDTRLPNVILRNVLENPAWYTAYTPYQPEIAQGRLEALTNFQQMVMDLTGMELANASLLDEGTAAAEAMAMAKRLSKNKSNAFFVDVGTFPQTIDVIKTRAVFFGFELIFGVPEDAVNHDVFGVFLQTPNDKGEVCDLSSVISKIKAKGAIVVVASDLMALVLLKSPAEMGADIALGSSQRFGIPMGFGGPHAAFFATKDEHKRQLPGRMIGVSVDVRGKKALRMSLQTREQHIRREKANSNICTSQVLLANLAGMYAVYHGAEGLKTIATAIHRLTVFLASNLQKAGFTVLTKQFFDTIHVSFKDEKTARASLQNAELAGFNLRVVSATVLGFSLDEKTTRDDVLALTEILSGEVSSASCECKEADKPAVHKEILPPELLRQMPILTHKVFHDYHGEHAMLRYLKRLQNRDLALDQSMIALGSCTMKLNATAQMIPITWNEFANMHPFAPSHQTEGYKQMIDELEAWLTTITGMNLVCMQPNSGAQGEYAGIVTILRYLKSIGQGARNICLIPQSAHGTNPATAQMCGLNIVTVACDEKGNINVDDLRAKAQDNAANLACLMVTYPSTHGVYEESISDICKIIHENGGQVYMDGANLNAQVGLTSPGLIGADVCHMNLHKTFAIPHGGGGPGMGPIALKSHLAPFIPNHAVQKVAGAHEGQSAVSAAPWGSASILPIPWMYIAMMGADGLTEASRLAILNANYIATKLNPHFPVLYTGKNGRVAHECIVDLRPLKAATGISETDVAKRLMDYGFHAPTVSFPVAGTLMIEPTESEPKAELDRFIAAMIAIAGEIENVKNGVWDATNNPLKNAPHTQDDIVDENWNRPYSRKVAAFPLPFVAENKFWPFVNRIDEVYGDRNLFCGCMSMDDLKA